MGILHGLPLAFSEIQSFFSGYGVAANLTSYYRGGGLVPNVSQNANIPTSGPIRISDFVTSTNWPIDGNQIVGNIPSYGLVGFPGGSSSAHTSSWFINQANQQVVQGPFDGSSGSADPTLTGIHPVFNGVPDPSSPMGTMIRYQNFISQFCIGGMAYPTGYALYNPQGGGTLQLNYGTALGNQNQGPSGGQTLNVFGGTPVPAPGSAFVSTAIYLMISEGVVSGQGNQELLNQLRSYNWNVTTFDEIAANFEAFANWVLTN